MTDDDTSPQPIPRKVEQLAMLQFGPAEIGLVCDLSPAEVSDLGDDSTDLGHACVLGRLLAERKMRLALFAKAADGDTAAIKEFRALIEHRRQLDKSRAKR